MKCRWPTARAQPQYPACPARAGRRAVPPCRRPRARPGGARAPRRTDRGFDERRRAGRRDACGLVERARARAHPRPDEPADRPRRHARRRATSRNAPPKPLPTSCTATAPRAAPMRGSRATRGAIRVYTPHGGSLHYRWCTPAGLLYLAAERALMRRTDLFLFESAYGRDVFRAKVGEPRALVRVVHNGVTAREFEPVDARSAGARSRLRGRTADAQRRRCPDQGDCAPCPRRAADVSATIAGDGPDAAAFEAQARGGEHRGSRAFHRRNAGAAQPLRWDGCWSFRRARNRCPMWCSKRRRRAFR